MAYGNQYGGNSYGGRSGGYNRDNRGSGWQNRPQGQGTGSPRPVQAEILPETVPADFVDKAELVMQEIQSQRIRITTSKIRNLLSLVSDIYNVEKLRTDAELLPESVAKVGMMRVRTAYEAGRDANTKDFVEKAKLLSYLKGIGTNREDLIRFARYMEALVAYHRFYGGKEA